MLRWTFLLSAFFVLGADPLAGSDRELSLELRSRIPVEAASPAHHTVTTRQSWSPTQTAIIVCDMWDLHHCLNATRRGGEMAPRMNRLLEYARKQGVTIIHAPSSCMETYKDHPARQRAIETPKAANLPEEITSWCRKIAPEDQGKYPLDQSDGGEDDDKAEHAWWAGKLAAMGRNPRAPWKAQTKLLAIHNTDYISSKGDEVWSILEHNKLQNVILLGVHTNMCVLGRPFGLRQMARNGKNVVLVRDLTDTMYNPERWPYVSHFTGTDLIVEHIEKFVCPTITSDQIIGGRPFRFAHDKRPHLVVVMAEQLYKSAETLPKFAVEHLGKSFRISYVYANAKDKNDLPGIDILSEADVVMLSVRRRHLPKAQLGALREYLARGKPLVALRTSSHAFSLRNALPEGALEAWPEFDAEILGGNYENHHPKGLAVRLHAAEGAHEHPILVGVDVTELVSAGSLYRVSPLKESATPLLIGAVDDVRPEPVAWVNITPAGGRVFYTSLGHPGDFARPAMNRLLRNAVHWAATVGTTLPPTLASLND